jgi:TctA family transporter
LGFVLSQLEAGDVLTSSILLFMIPSFIVGIRLGDVSGITQAFPISQPIPFAVGMFLSAVITPPKNVFPDMAVVRFGLMFSGAVLLVLFAIAGLVSALVGGLMGERLYESGRRRKLRPLPPLKKKPPVSSEPSSICDLFQKWAKGAV